MILAQTSLSSEVFMPILATLAVVSVLLAVVGLVRDHQYRQERNKHIFWKAEAASLQLVKQSEDRECQWCGDIAGRTYGQRSYGAAVHEHIEHYRERAYSAESKLVHAARREKQLRAELADRTQTGQYAVSMPQPHVTDKFLDACRGELEKIKTALLEDQKRHVQKRYEQNRQAPLLSPLQHLDL